MNRNLAPLEGSLDRGLVVCDGYVAIGSDGYVAASRFTAGSITISASDYTSKIVNINLTDPYIKLISCNLQVMAATAVDLVPQLVSEDVVAGGAQKIVFKLLTGASAANPSAACRVYVSLILDNRTA